MSDASKIVCVGVSCMYLILLYCETNLFCVDFKINDQNVAYGSLKPSDLESAASGDSIDI